jgi:hypothetical protein
MQKQAEAPHPDRIQKALALLLKVWAEDEPRPEPQTPAA